MTDGTPIAYSALAPGTPVCTRDGQQFATVEHVLQIPAEDLFDGLVVRVGEDLRFVDRDQLLSITDRAVTCDLDGQQAADLPRPSGTAVYSADGFQDAGSNLHDHFARLFLRGRWQPEQDQG
jgi:hypothetical protein